MADVTSGHWYEVHTRPHCEAQAAVHIARQGFETYFQHCLKKRLELLGRKVRVMLSYDAIATD